MIECVLPNLCSLNPDFLSSYFCILLLHGKNLVLCVSDSLGLIENLMNIWRGCPLVKLSFEFTSVATNSIHGVGLGVMS